MSEVKLTCTDTSSQSFSSDETKNVAETVPDFTLLPDVIWVEVLKLLTVQERYSLSQTCRKLHNLFSSPSVWKSVALSLSVNSFGDFPPNFVMAFLAQWQLSVLEKFGHCIQNVTLKGVCDHDLDRRSYCAILSLQHWKTLRSFTVHIEESSQHTFFRNIESDQELEEASNIYNILSPICNMTQRPSCSVYIHYAHSESGLLGLYSDVFKCSPSDFRCQQTHSLQIDHVFLTNVEKIIGITFDPPRPSPTADLVSRFPALHHLSLCDSFFSDQLLETLADMRQKGGFLRTLTVQFKTNQDGGFYDSSDEENEPHDQEDIVKNLSSTAWSRLASACPQLQVFCSFGSFENVERVIKAEAPLVSIEIRSYRPGYIPFDDFESFCFEHRVTLQELRYSHVQVMDNKIWWLQLDGEPEELPIASVVTECPKLVDLYYEGVIDRNNVIKLAELDRKWRSLEIFNRVIIREGQSDRDPTTEELKELEVTMSQHLGYTWEFSEVQDSDSDSELEWEWESGS